MQIVIDISKEEYEHITEYYKNVKGIIPALYALIADGTPLPEGHGELIDRGQALNECYNISVDGERFKVVQYETLLGVPTIIEADKE